MLHETSIGDGKEVFLQKNKKKEKELTFYAIRGLIHGIYWSATFDFDNRNELPNLVPSVHSYPPYGARGREGKFQPEKRLPKVLGDLFRAKIRRKWAIIPLFGCSKILGEAGKQKILQQIFRKFQISNRLPNRYFPKIDVGCPCLKKVQRKPFT